MSLHPTPAAQRRYCDELAAVQRYYDEHGRVPEPDDPVWDEPDPRYPLPAELMARRSAQTTDYDGLPF